MTSKTKKFFYLSNLTNINFKLKYVLLVLVNFINVVLEFLGLASIVPFIEYITKSSKDLFGFNSIIEKINIFLNISEIQIYILIILSIFLLRNFFGIFSVYLHTRYVHEFTINLSNFYFKNRILIPFLAFTDKGSNVFIRNLRDVISNFRAFLLSSIMFFSEFLILLSILSLFLYLNFLTTIVILLILVLILFFFIPFIKKKIVNWSFLRNSSAASINKVLLNTFNNIREIKVFNKEKFISKYFNKFNYNYSDVLRKYDFSIIVLRNYVEIAIIVIIFFSSLFFFYEKNSDQIITMLGFYIVAFVRLYPSINRFISYYLGIKNNQVAVETLYEEFQFINQFSKNSLQKNRQYNFDKSINVKIDYHQFLNSKNKILENVNFDIKQNTLFGINGPNGTGKTTLSNFILGLIKPTSGKILLDDKYNIEQFQNDYRKILSFVPQNTFLFEGSIYDNIVFGEIYEDKEKLKNEKKVQQIINSSKIFKFINNLDNKMHMEIKENATNLSGGQKQCISIARALYYNPKILILDEPTNSLDKDIKLEFFDLISSLKNNITIIAITHDQGLLEICDDKINLANK